MTAEQTVVLKVGQKGVEKAVSMADTRVSASADGMVVQMVS